MLPLKEFVSTAVTTQGIGGGGASTNEKGERYNPTSPADRHTKVENVSFGVVAR